MEKKFFIANFFFQVKKKKKKKKIFQLEKKIFLQLRFFASAFFAKIVFFHDINLTPVQSQQFSIKEDCWWADANSYQFL